VIGFWDYFRVGGPLTVLTLLVGTFWLMANALQRDPKLEGETGARPGVWIASEGYGAGVYEAVVTTLAERRG